MAEHGTRKSQLINNYSGNAGLNRTTGISSNDSTLKASGFEPVMEENDSTETFVNNNIQIMPAAIKSEEKESKNFPSAQILTDGFYNSVFQLSITPVFQIAYYPL